VRGDSQWPALAAMLAAEAARQLGDEGQQEKWQSRLAALHERRTPETKELPRPGVSPTD